MANCAASRPFWFQLSAFSISAFARLWLRVACAVSRLYFCFLSCAFCFCPAVACPGHSMLDVGCWMLDVRCWMFGVHHKHPEYNVPLPPPPGWSGGTLVPPWTYPGTIAPLPNPILDQAGLSDSASCDSSVGQRRRGLEVGDSRFDGGCPVFPARRSRFAVGLRCPAPLSNA